MNRGELVTRAGRIMGMARSSTDNVEEVTYLQQLANEAVVDLLSRTKLHVRRTALELTGDVTDYDLSQAVLRLWSLSEDGVELDEVPEGDLLSMAGSKVFQFTGQNMFVIGWEPEDGDTIDALYTPRPTKMTVDAHDPATVTYGLVPEEHHGALVNWMCWKAGETTRDEGSGMGEKWRRLYEGEDGLERIGTNVGNIKWAINRRGSTGLSPGRIRRMGERSNADLGASTWR